MHKEPDVQRGQIIYQQTYITKWQSGASNTGHSSSKASVGSIAHYGVPSRKVIRAIELSLRVSMFTLFLPQLAL